MLYRIVMTAIAYLIMGAAVVIISRLCWKDSKEDFKAAWCDFVHTFKKKKTD